MFNTDMRTYDYFTLGGTDSCGQPVLSAKQGFIKMAIYLNSQNIADNIKYRDAAYVGLTHDAKVNDSYVIQYKDSKLKVLYVNPQGRFKQVYMVDYFD